MKTQLKQSTANDLEQHVYQEVMHELAAGKLVLPTLPEVALKVRDAIEEENVSTPGLAKILSSDPALCARVIKIANSAAVGGGKRVDTLEQAIVRLGSRALRNTVTSAIMQQMFQATTDATDHKLREIWSHSSTVAAICHSLAPMARLTPDTAMLAGLVHDIGALPVLKKAEDYPELTASMDVLESLISKLHVAVGTAILRAWDFPPELIDVVAEHEKLKTRPVGGRGDYVDLVIVANLQIHQDDDHQQGAVDWSQYPSFERLGFAPETYAVELENESEKIEATRTILDS